MWVELVRTRTADGVRLEGALQPAWGGVNRRTAVDAVMLLPGVGANFYGSTLMHTLTLELLQRGMAVLRPNTRGHDGISTASTAQGGRLQGAAYEIVDDCRYDLEAWSSFLLHRGYRQVALVGHSLGALKSLYSQARQPSPEVACLVAISPPRLSYSRFLEHADREKLLQSLAEAERLVAAGRPQMLFEASFPFPLVLSAATFVDKYGPRERYNFLRFAHQIRQPLTFIYGEDELTHASAAFLDVEREVSQVDWSNAGPGWKLIPGANHFFSGRMAELASVTGMELERLAPR
jgi:pimeloyl-ACP methyl ester carboxylesterase